VSRADDLKKKLMSKPTQTAESSQATAMIGMTDTQIHINTKTEEDKIVNTQDIKNTNTQTTKNTRKTPNSSGNVQATFYLPKEKARKLKVISALQDRTMSELAEEAIDIVIAKYEGNNL